MAKPVPTRWLLMDKGVSCDACLKGNFRGRRYKCLICYDYDLCATCYESGATTTRHTTDHPMQCILTRVDFGPLTLLCFMAKPVPTRWLLMDKGVSCDACLKGNFRGRRYKCLICYDYDLCATCYESGATTTRHTTDHPMQCILTRVDFDLYYGGEAFSVEQPQSFTCPYCGKMGYTETSLQEHVASEHTETSTEVICPICAALPGGDPNHVTDDFAAHLTLEHRAPRDLDESSGVRHVRRMFHPGRGLGGPRARRSNMHFTSSSTGGLSSSQSSYSPSNRETMDPIAGSLKLDTALWMWLHQCQTEGKNHFPGAAGCAPTTKNIPAKEDEKISVILMS
ncbi:E3 ubiquitin-protein ligase KCMF1-like isoform 8-T9 [Amazona ochrocephala]